MIRFPKGFYSDIRIEDTKQTDIALENGDVRQNRVRSSCGALIRLYDGSRWYYQATTQMEMIQTELDQLAQMAKRPVDIHSDPVVQVLESNKEKRMRYQDQSVQNIDRSEKLALLKDYDRLCRAYPEISMYKSYYTDNVTIKTFLSSKGADLQFDTQSAAVAIRYNLTVNGKLGRGGKETVKTSFPGLAGQEQTIRAEIEKDITFVRDAVPVEPGVYTCVLAPVVTGVFAHESFGHKSEADFMIGDETMMNAWAIGSVVGSENLNIMERGDCEGNGYVPFDDEGTRARLNYIIQNGRLSGRLHSSVTAASLHENLTGNARAVNFEFEPIVRMTNTYIGGGTLTFDELIRPVRNGLFIEDLHHGSGMTTFTIAPHRAYRIRDGAIAEPVQISVISGNVMETLHHIDGFSRDVEFFSFAMGGCGKMEQFPLRVAFGGPYIRVNGIVAQ